VGVQDNEKKENAAGQPKEVERKALRPRKKKNRAKLEAGQQGGEAQIMKGGKKEGRLKKRNRRDLRKGPGGKGEKKGGGGSGLSEGPIKAPGSSYGELH